MTFFTVRDNGGTKFYVVHKVLHAIYIALASSLIFPK